MKQDPSLKLLLFSSIEQPLGNYSLHDVTFPSQFEVKINQDEVKANFKGLKNKPGSTRPADITEYVRKTPGYRNSIQITYALTQKAGEEEKVSFVIPEC
jgi:E3 SUMO-protein ligase PIAS1